LRVLPESELPSSVLDGYEAALVLAETSSAEYELARSGDTNARVSLVSVQTGLAMSRRMQRCLGYNLEGDEEVERQLADIREGSGHADLANDLAELSVLDGTHNEALRGDGRNYRASAGAARGDEEGWAEVGQGVRGTRCEPQRDHRRRALPRPQGQQARGALGQPARARATHVGQARKDAQAFARRVKSLGAVG
jgi:hypothetical protein